MELRNDDLHSVSLMADSLADSLAQSRAKTVQIEDLVKSIAATANIDINGPVAQETQEDADAELSRLKEENLQLLMDIQRQEFLSKQWNAAITQNQRLLDTIKEWGETHPAQLRGSYKEFQARASVVVEELNESIRMLNEDVVESHGEVQGLLKIVEELQALVDDDIEIASEIQRNIQLATKKVQQLQDMYISHISK